LPRAYDEPIAAAIAVAVATYIQAVVVLVVAKSILIRSCNYYNYNYELQTKL
jgi:hypothetical protein